MSTPQPNPPKASPRWFKPIGPALTAGLALTAELLSRSNVGVPNLVPVLLAGVVYSAFTGGLAMALVSGATAWLYALAFYSIPGQPFHYASQDLPRLLVISAVIPGTALMSGILKRRTERLAAAQAAHAEARAAEQLFRERLGDFDSMVYEAEPGTFHCRFVTENVERILGYPSARWLNEPDFWTTHLHPDDRERALAERGRVLLDRTEHELNYRFLTAGGAWAWVRDRARGVPSAGGAGSLVRGSMVDITERMRAEAALRRRDAILEALSFAAERLLTETDWERGIQAVLQRLGIAVDVSRVYIFENHDAADGSLLTSQRYEWCAPGVASQTDNPALQGFAWQANGFGRWEEAMRRGEVIHGRVEAFPEAERAVLAPQGILSILVVPIFASRAWWGHIGFDDCVAEREWSPAVMDALTTAARALGGAFQRRESEARLQASEAKFRALLETAPDAIVIIDPQGQVVLVNGETERLWGYARGEIVGHSVNVLLPERFRMTPRDLSAGMEASANLTLAGRRKDGSEFPIEIGVRPIDMGEGRLIIIAIRDVAERVRAEAEHARLVVEQVARAEAEAAQRRIAFLAEASRVLASSLDYATTLASIAKMSVPELADWCAVDILEEDGRIRPIAVAHADQRKVVLAREMQRRFPHRVDSGDLVPRVVRTGQPVLLPEVNDSVLGTLAHDPGHLKVLKRAGFKSAMTVPLSARGRTLGTITLASAESGRTYTQDDLALAEALGRRAALAVDNARLYRSEKLARKAAERSADRTARLQTATAALSQALTPAQVAQVIADQVVPALHASAGSLGILTDDGRRLELIPASGAPQAAPNTLHWFHSAISAYGAGGTQSDHPIWLRPDEGRSGREGKVWAVVPLTFEDRVIGALGLTFDRVRKFSTEDRAFLLALAQQCAQALERARLYGDEQRARAQAEGERMRFAFLASASDVLGASLDYEVTVGNIVRLAVPTLADWCMVEVLEEDGTIRLLALAHVDPGKAARGREVYRRHPTRPDATAGVPQAILTGQTVLECGVTGEALAHIVEDGEHLRLWREVGVRSAMIVPLRVHRRTLGAMTFLMADSGRQYTPGDQALTEEVARRAAAAIENAHLYREAREAVRIRERFLSIASHELRTPLTVIRGFLEGLTRFVEKAAGQGGQTSVTLDRARVEGMLTKMDRATGRLERLIEELLDATRIQSGRLSISPERMNFGELLGSVLEGIRQRLDTGQYNRQVVLRAEAATAGELWGCWDRGRLEQVLTNLIDNAVKYSPAEGTVTVRVDVEAGSAIPCLHVSVRDQGIGVPPEEQGQIFGPLYRASNASEGGFSGLGLGLAISKEIVERHHGRIWVESEGSNQGSVFHVTLPMEAGATRAPAASAHPSLSSRAPE